MSDNPCIKPDFELISGDPLIEDCTIPGAPPPITDGPDLNISPPTAADEAALLGGGRVVPVVVKSKDAETCVIKVQRIVFEESDEYTMTGGEFDAFAMAFSCACDNVWPGMLGYASYDGLAEKWVVAFTDASPVLVFKLKEDRKFDLNEESSNEGELITGLDADIYVANDDEYIDSEFDTRVFDVWDRYPCSKAESWGMAVCNPSNDGSYRWEVIYMQEPSDIITFEADESIDGPGEYRATVAEVHGRGAFFRPDVGDKVNVISTLDWEATTMTRGLAQLSATSTEDESDESLYACGYIIVNMDCNQ